MLNRNLYIILAAGAALAIAGCGKEPAAPEPAAPAGSAAPMSAEQPHPMPAAEVADVDLSGIEKAADGITVIPTPGHAPHHISFLHRGTLFVGEAAGTFLDLGQGHEQR